MIHFNIILQKNKEKHLLVQTNIGILFAHTNQEIPMIRSTLAIATLLTGLAQAADYSIDKSHTRIGFSISHLSISSVDGNFKNFQGNISWDDKNIGNSSMNVTIDGSSINTDDEKRDEHLRSPDFFEVAKYNTIQFQSNKIVAKGGNRYVVMGQLSLHGVTKPVQIPFTMAGPVVNPYKQTVRAFKGSFTINRKDYQIGNSFPNAIVGDAVTINISAEAVQK